jgi:hypothetical protein
MSAEAAVAMEEKTVGSGHKRPKLVASRSSPPGAKPSTSLKIVQVSEGHTDVTAEPPPIRQYLTQSRAAASSTLRHPGKLVGMGCCPSKSSSTADSKTQGNTSSASSPFL